MEPTSRAPDRRIRRTREALHAALLAVMVEKGYDAVTVQDVADRADVSRSTFYAHFPDKEALLVSGIEALRPLLVRDGEIDGQQQETFAFSLRLLLHVQSHRHLLRVLAPRTGGAVVQRWFTKLVSDLVRAEFSRLRHRLGIAVPTDLEVAFLVGAFMSVLSTWLASGCAEGPEDVDRVFQDLALHGFQGLNPRA